MKTVTKILDIAITLILIFGGIWIIPHVTHLVKQHQKSRYNDDYKNKKEAK